MQNQIDITHLEAWITVTWHNGRLDHG